MTSLHALIESVLIEGRLQDAERKYGPRLGPGVVAKLSKADPSGKNKYLMWAAKRASTGSDIDDVIKAMVAFHKNATRLKKRDINQYKTAADVMKATGALGATKGSKRRAIKKDADVVFQDDDFLVIHPKTTAASQKYGRGTKWCTAATDSENYFCSYAGFRNVFLFYIIAKKDMPRKYEKIALALHPDTGEDGEYYDSADDGMTLPEVKRKLGTSSRPLLKAVYAYMKRKGRTVPSKSVERLDNPSTPEDWEHISNLDPNASVNFDIAKVIAKGIDNPKAPLSFREKMIKRASEGKLEGRIRSAALNQLRKDYWTEAEILRLMKESEGWKWWSPGDRETFDNLVRGSSSISKETKKRIFFSDLHGGKFKGLSYRDRKSEIGGAARYKESMTTKDLDAIYEKLIKGFTQLESWVSWVYSHPKLSQNTKSAMLKELEDEVSSPNAFSNVSNEDMEEWFEPGVPEEVQLILLGDPDNWDKFEYLEIPDEIWGKVFRKIIATAKEAIASGDTGKRLRYAMHDLRMVLQSINYGEGDVPPSRAKIVDADWLIGKLQEPSSRNDLVTIFLMNNHKFSGLKKADYIKVLEYIHLVKGKEWRSVDTRLSMNAPNYNRGVPEIEAIYKDVQESLTRSPLVTSRNDGTSS